MSWWWEMVELWWCSLEMPCWCLMSSQSSLMHVVGSHAIWCLGAMGCAHDGDDLALITWWIWHALMEMVAWWWVRLWWRWHDDVDMPLLDPWWHDTLMEMTYMMSFLLMRIPYPFLNPSSTLNPSLHPTLPLNPSYILALYITLPKPLPKHHFLTTLPYPLPLHLASP